MGRGSQRKAAIAAARRADDGDYTQVWHETYETALREGKGRGIAAFRADSHINALKVADSGRPPVGAGDFEPYY